MLRIPSLRIGRLRGIPLEVNASWLLIFALSGWGLSTEYFSAMLAAQPSWVWFVTGYACALLAFACLLVHEYAHAYVAVAQGIGVDRVTLFVFGGVAQLAEEPHTAGAEAVMAAAGPAASYVLAAASFGVGSALRLGGLAVLWPGLMWLAVFNLVAGTFNLIPAYPLDGGRLLHAYLWWARGDRASATTVAANAGRAAGALLAGVGVWLVVQGAWDGAWLGLMGIFIAWLAGRALHLQRPYLRFSATPVGALMAPWEPIADAWRIGPVAGDALPPGLFLDASESLQTAVERFSAQPLSALVVVEHGRAAGVLSRDQLARFMGESGIGS